jgi:hypothetical protein
MTLTSNNPKSARKAKQYQKSISILVINHKYSPRWSSLQDLLAGQNIRKNTMLKRDQ